MSDSMTNKTMDKQTAMQMAIHLLDKQITAGPLSPEGREMLAAALDLAKGKPVPCIHCGKDPHA